MTGRIHSIESMGTLDGPGVRTVVFMQGCPLRCVYCHNPDTWNPEEGRQIQAEELFRQIIKYKPYFNNNGGVTFSGGEPLLQSEFIARVMKLCRENHIHTALDTSGCIVSEQAMEVLSLSDLILLDIKMLTDELYQKYIGCSISNVLTFLSQAEKLQKQVWVRHVVVPGLNDTQDSIKQLDRLTQNYRCIKQVELLPFRKLCLEKYERLQLPFPLSDTPELSQKRLEELEQLIQKRR